MPTATVSGGLLGVAFELHSNKVQKRRFGAGRCALTMIAGAVVANVVSKWDKNAQERKQAERERKQALRELAISFRRDAIMLREDASQLREFTSKLRENPPQG